MTPLQISRSEWKARHDREQAKAKAELRKIRSVSATLGRTVIVDLSK
mgnify:CR=1 FL=1